jgi:hypothetical protein
VFPLSAGLTNALALGLGAGDLRRGPRASH